MLNNPFSLKNKIIVITGASSGIGEQCAKSISDFGATVVLIGRNKDRLKAVSESLNNRPHLMIPIDLTNYSEIEDAIKYIVNSIGNISGFVHSAGTECSVPISMMEPDNYEDLFAINTIAGFELAKVISKKKYIDSKGASFVFIASTMGIIGIPSLVGYSASKGALISGSKSLALELAKKKINVNCISPGHILGTNMTDNAFAKIPKEAILKLKDKYPLGFGDSNDIANACIFLLSDASKWITGTNLVIDGGYTSN